MSVREITVAVENDHILHICEHASGCVCPGARERAYVRARVALLIVICAPSGSTTFFDIISYTARFS